MAELHSVPITRLANDGAGTYFFLLQCLYCHRTKAVLSLQPEAEVLFKYDNTDGGGFISSPHVLQGLSWFSLMKITVFIFYSKTTVALASLS